MSRILLALLSVIPGAGVILRGYALLGSVLMIGGIFAWNVALVGFFLWQGEGGPLLGWTGLVVGSLSSLGSIAWTCVSCSFRRQKRLCAHADRSLRVAQMAYLRNKLGEASVAIEAGLNSCRCDVDLLFLGWQIAHEMSERRRAHRYLRRLRRNDIEGKWAWEVRRGLK